MHWIRRSAGAGFTAVLGLHALPAAASLAAPALAAAAPVARISPGDTAWVLLMTIPGRALFYAGMVQKKNILATMM